MATLPVVLLGPMAAGKSTLADKLYHAADALGARTIDALYLSLISHWKRPTELVLGLDGEALAALPAGHAFTTPDVLFAKIADERRAELEARFAGA